MDRSWALPAATALSALENAGLIGALLLVGSTPPLVPLFLVTKFPFCVGLAQRRHGAFMMLTFWEASTFVIGLINPALDLFARLAILGASGGGLVLLGLALRTFPEITLPDRAPGRWGEPG